VKVGEQPVVELGPQIERAHDAGHAQRVTRTVMPEAQLDELDKLTARWITDHSRRTKTSKPQRKTRHS
jgi:hypothetical protein